MLGKKMWWWSMVWLLVALGGCADVLHYGDLRFDGAGGPCTTPADCGVPADCFANICADHTCGTEAQAAGMACSSGESLLCDGNGACVECLEPADCPGQDTECATRVCNAGACALASAALDTPCSFGGLLKCDGNGACGAPPCSATLGGPPQASVGLSPESVAAADFNGDDIPDLAVANSGSNTVSLLLGLGNGAFAAKIDYDTDVQPYSVVAADFDGDGKPDLAVANASAGNVSVLLNKADGTGAFFSKVDYPAGDGPLSVAAADLNGDGTPDLAVANQNSDTVSVLLNKADGTGAFFSKVDYPAGDVPQSVAAADLNGDGTPDLAVANRGNDTVSVLLNKNNGTGTFFPKTDYPAGVGPFSVAAADLNGDGKADLAVANVNSSNVVLLNNGAGTFTAALNYDAGMAATSVAVADLNADGKPDLAFVSYQVGDVRVLLNNGDGTFAGAVNYDAGMAATSVAVADLNADGKPDFAVTNQNSSTVSVLLNQGGGTFTTAANYPAGMGLTSVVAADLNGDGTPDLAVANGSASTVSVLLNKANGTGAFFPKADYTAGDGANSVVAADLNGDGTSDLAVANHYGGTVSVLLNKANGTGTFFPKADYTVGDSPLSVAAADLNGDGKPDLAVANYFGGTVSVLFNKANGAGTFFPKTDYATGAFTRAVAAADLNGDGKADLAVANDEFSGENVSVRLNNGNGTFLPRRDYTAGDGPFSVAAADLNGDGKPDLAVANEFSDNVSVLLKQGNGTTGTFSAAASYPAGDGPHSVAVADVNGDNKPDLVVANHYGGNVSVLLNQGDGTFAAPLNYGAGKDPSSVAVTDVNGDGRLDLAVANFNGTVSVLLQTCLP